MFTSAVTNLRHEIKLLITYADYVALSKKIGALLPKDSFTSDTGDYFIRSLYLADEYISSYREKMAGSDKRKKYRIRIYNCSDNVIKLECKQKVGARICKTSCSITKEMFEEYINGNPTPLLKSEHDLAKEVYSLTRSKLLSPMVVVDYDREAYVHPLSNTRITFDKFLHAGINDVNIFNKDLLTYPVFTDDLVILEIKYDYFFPSYLADLLKTVRGKKIALSKYCMCADAMLNLNNAAVSINSINGGTY